MKDFRKLTKLEIEGLRQSAKDLISEWAGHEVLSDPNHSDHGEWKSRQVEADTATTLLDFFCFFEMYSHPHSHICKLDVDSLLSEEELDGVQNEDPDMIEQVSKKTDEHYGFVLEFE